MQYETNSKMVFHYGLGEDLLGDLDLPAEEKFPTLFLLMVSEAAWAAAVRMPKLLFLLCKE